MSLLSAVREFCLRTGIDRPTSVTSSQDKQVLQLWGLANEVMTDLLDRKDWQELRQEAMFTSVAAEDQGALTTIADQGFYAFWNETIYDRTQKVEICGPVSPQGWQQRKANGIYASAYASFRIMDGHLHITPAMEAGHSCYFEYKTDRLVSNAAGTAFTAAFEADTDVCRLTGGDTLLLLGLRWKWKSEKGLAYGEEFAAYEAKIGALSLANAGRKTIHLDQPPEQPPGTLVIPLSNWNT